MGMVSIKQYNGETQVHIQFARTNRNGFKTFMLRGRPARIEDFKQFAERQVDTNSALFQWALRWNDLSDRDAKRSIWNKLNSDWLNAFKASKTGSGSMPVADAPASTRNVPGAIGGMV
jgi:hypothetical protein